MFLKYSRKVQDVLLLNVLEQFKNISRPTVLEQFKS